MKILVFDTCFDKTYITLTENTEILVSKEIVSSGETYHSAFLLPTIVEILKSFNITMKSIDAIGVNIGPGSFTGIRVCLTLARVFAQQLNLKLIGIPSLQILSKINNTDKNSSIVLDARKNKVYYAEYTKDNTVVKAPCIVEKDDLKELLKDNFIISDNSISSYLSECNIESNNFQINNYPLGNYLAELTYKMLNSNSDDFHWAKVKPLYIQPPSITRPKELNNV